MKELNIGGKIEEIKLNGHFVSVITPKRILSYEEGMKRIDKLISEAKKKK